MYSRTVTQRIIELQALGFSAEETRKRLRERDGMTLNLNTVYTHRRSSVGKEIIDELVRMQLRSIAYAAGKGSAQALKYRNELLKILIPVRIESLSIQKTEATVNVSVEDLLKQYERFIAERAMGQPAVHADDTR
jgi:intein-encoded DNA endonuclease-like protein